MPFNTRMEQFVYYLSQLIQFIKVQFKETGIDRDKEFDRVLGVNTLALSTKAVEVLTRYLDSLKGHNIKAVMNIAFELSSLDERNMDETVNETMKVLRRIESDEKLSKTLWHYVDTLILILG